MDRMDAEEEPRSGMPERLSKRVQARSLPPVERWQPPYCGDIGLADSG